MFREVVHTVDVALQRNCWVCQRRGREAMWWVSVFVSTFIYSHINIPALFFAFYILDFVVCDKISANLVPQIVHW